MVQLAGHDMLRAKGVTLIAASAPTFFLEDTPTAVLVRRVLGGIAQFEKAGLVLKLAAARKRKRVATGKCEGRKSLAETNPDAVALAKHLARKRPKGGQLSLRAVSAELAKQGFLNERGQPFNHKSVATMPGEVVNRVDVVGVSTGFNDLMRAKPHIWPLATILPCTTPASELPGAAARPFRLTRLIAATATLA
jgi:hypothetical protein